MPEQIPDPQQAATELREALRAMRPAQSLSAESQEHAYALGFAWLESADFDKARAAFDALWLSCPDEARYAAGLAYSALGQGQIDVALSYFMLAANLDEDNAGYLLGLGRAFQAGNLPGHAGMALDIAKAMATQAQDRRTADMAEACLRLMEKPA